MQGSDRPSFSFPELRSVCGSASAIHTDQDPSSGNENDRPYVCLPDFLDTGLPRGNVNERDSGPMRGACHPYPTSQPVKVGHTTGGIKSPLSSNSYAGSFTSLKKKWLKVLWDRTYGFSSLSEKTMKSNHLQMSLLRQHFLLSYLKTLSVVPAGVWTRVKPCVRLDCAYTRFVPTRLTEPFNYRLSFSHVGFYCLLQPLEQYFKIAVWELTY